MRIANNKDMNYDVQVIGIDYSKFGDFTFAICRCGQCGSIIFGKKYSPEINEINIPFFIKCPECDTIFKKRIIIEG